MPLDKFQRIVAGSYEGGEFSHVSGITGASEMGDGLFRFLLAEISEAEGCDSLEEAHRRLHTAKRQINEILQAIEDEDDGAYFKTPKNWDKEADDE